MQQKKTLLYPNLHAELVRIGKTVTDLADYLNMTSQNLYAKLRGARVLSIKDMKAIREFFIASGGGAFTLDYLFKESGD